MSAADNSSNNINKKRKLGDDGAAAPSSDDVAVIDAAVSAAQLDLQHQVTSLQFGYDASSGWRCHGQTTLYVINNSSSNNNKTKDSNTNNATTAATTPKQQQQQQQQQPVELALHLRNSVTVDHVVVEQQPSKNGNNALEPIAVQSFHHVDPLYHVLVAPVVNGDTNNDNSNKDDHNNGYKFDADAQSSRGATGMTTGLRAASMASNLGELRVFVVAPPPPAVDETAQGSTSDANNNSQQTAATIAAATTWRQDLEQQLQQASDGDGDSRDSVGEMAERLHAQLQQRVQERRRKRLDLVAQRLAAATSGAYKVTIAYRIPLDDPPSVTAVHRAGLHVINNSASPHLYTTVGTYGDHEGPRAWVPTVDSAAVQHRATHALTVAVTAPVTQGLSVAGCGEDFGATATVLHDATSDRDALQRQVGSRHYQNIVIADPYSAAATTTAPEGDNSANNSDTHVIPPDTVSLDTIRATTVWCTHAMTPIPSRSLGFAIGPFKVLEDPEYFGPALLEDDDKDNGGDDDDDSTGNEEEKESFENRLAARLEKARAQGEGIRQVYFAPLWERKHIHTNTATTNNDLLPNTTLRLLPPTPAQRTLARQLDDAVLSATVGVPHRALSIVRDCLALPVYRTAAYTQIWIPNAVHGGCTSGALHDCPEVLVNCFLGGSVTDSRLLPPVRARLPYHQGGRALQFLQARGAVRGWITAALPLGGHDDVGNGYLLTLIESFLMSLYERGHGGQGEGGGKGGMFHSPRYSQLCGLNSANLDFLPVQNIEEIDVVIEGVGAVPVEDRHNEQLWRGANNGSESHTSAMDEFNTRQLLIRDCVEALERRTMKDRGIPSPSMGWFGSYFSLTFFSSNATSSSDLGCGAMELLHPVGGLVYRTLKSELFRGVVEGRAGVANFIRLVRAAFIAAHLEDMGEKELKLPKRKKKSEKTASTTTKEEPKSSSENPDESSQPKQPFVVCINEILKKKGLTHTLFTRALQNLSGRIKEPQLLGTLVDVDRLATDPRTQRPFVEPEGFPNSYVRGASLLYCRVGVQVEVARDATSTKGIQMQAYAEPIIPEGGIAYGGPITIRVVENEGSFREYVKDLLADGSRRDWGAMFLHAKPVTTQKAQTAASGTIENTASSKHAAKSPKTKTSTMGSPATSNAFTDADFHSGGYQAIELVRLTNLTPLLWVRVDPLSTFGGRISVFQPDACLAEQLFHDGDAGAQIDALRALAERPLRIQGSVKVKTVYDVNVSELPVRLLGDCLRGSPALHSSLPHTPVVRAQAALTIAQWQNNKAPASKNAVGSEVWVGINILVQYFRERFYSSAVVMPTKFTRITLKKNEAEIHKSAAANEGGANSQPSYDDTYVYLDALDESERIEALKAAESIEMEEDEEYRVRSAVVTAIACVRAQDGMTPPLALQFLETVLESEDAEMVTNLSFGNEDNLFEEKYSKLKASVSADPSDSDNESSQGKTSLKVASSFVSSMLVADTLLALCNVNAMADVITDPATGKTVQSSAPHPLSRLMQAARSWLDWELYRENIRLQVAEKTQSGVSGNCYDTIAACAIFALSNLAILRQSTTESEPRRESKEEDQSADAASSRFYIDIFDSRPLRNDLTRAAAAQALCCIFCASDRFEKAGVQPVGLLSCLNFLLERINENETSTSLRHTLASVMMDVCTGKVCSMQRVGAIAGRNDLIQSVARFYNGPLGACHGGDNGSAVLTAVSVSSFPAAAAVNDGARRGMRLLSRAGHPKETIDKETVVRVARFATRLWRTINGERPDLPNATSGASPAVGLCAFDGMLRSSLLALWQLLWPRGCFAVLQVQSWRQHEATPLYRDMGAQYVMQISDKEKEAASVEESLLADINRFVEVERDRQMWRGEMAKKAYDMYKASKGSTPVQDIAAAEQGIGQPLPPIARDESFKQGGWIASAAQQRRAMKLDGGTAVTKLRLTVKKDD